MTSDRNTRRRKWLLDNGFNLKDVEFLIALFETEQAEKSKRRNSVGGGNSAERQRKKTEIPGDYRIRSPHYGGSSPGNQDHWWRRTYDVDHRRSSKRDTESIDTKEHQRIVDQDADEDDDDVSVESLRALVDELTALLN